MPLDPEPGMTTQSPLDATALADEYFIENRNRLLEIAAFLDRLDRADPRRASRDFRLRALTDALAILASPGPGYVREIQRLLSDPTTEPIDALDRKSALGAYRGHGEVRS
jgi:hypothetical protein